VCVCTYDSLGEIRRQFSTSELRGRPKASEGHMQSHFQCVLSPFPGLKRPEGKANHSPQSNSEVKNMWMDATHPQASTGSRLNKRRKYLPLPLPNSPRFHRC